MAGKFHQHVTLDIETGAREELVDIMDQVLEAVARSGIRQGICVVFCPHTTAGITINENADPDVARDILAGMGKLAPRDAGYLHAEGNSDGHIKSSLFGPSLNLIVKDGSPVLGTWQGLYFCEWDGPRNRKLHIKVIEG